MIDRLPARLSALLLAILALAALRAGFDLLPPGQDMVGRLWLLSGHFTVLTGLLAAAALLAVTRGWRIGARPAGALTTAMLLVFATALMLPRPAFPLFSAESLAQDGLTLALPLGCLLWWMGFAPKSLGRGDLPALMAWPLTFAALTLLRGVKGELPDPFLTIPLSLTTPLFLALAAVLALAVIGLARLMARRGRGR